MDHSECRKRICQLEDDLDYNLERKDQLKEEVQKLDESNDRLRKLNFKNAEVSIKKESVLNKLVETLRKELDELKSVGHIETLKAENMVLKEKIKSQKEEDEIVSNSLKAENKNLEIKMKNLLKCDDCDIQFDRKSSLKDHILSNHVAKELSCNECVKNFKVKQPLLDHVIKEQSSKSKRFDLQKRLHDLTNRITDQRINLHKDLFKLKQKDLMEKGKCNCQGKFCKINHSRFRWTMSKADGFFSRLILISPEYLNNNASGSNFHQCDKCEIICKNMEGMKTHNEINHSQNDFSDAQESILGSFSYECEMCEEILDDTDNLQKHIETEHTQHFKCKLCDHEFSKDISLGNHIESEHVTTHKCQQCEMTFMREKNLEIHIKTDHADNLLESTFFNPSAVN